MSRERSPTSSSLQEPGTKLGLEGWGVGGRMLEGRRGQGTSQGQEAFHCRPTSAGSFLCCPEAACLGLGAAASGCR